jgi:hypothetical protein
MISPETTARAYRVAAGSGLRGRLVCGWLLELRERVDFFFTTS